MNDLQYHYERCAKEVPSEKQADIPTLTEEFLANGGEIKKCATNGRGSTIPRKYPQGRHFYTSHEKIGIELNWENQYGEPGDSLRYLF